MKNLLNDSNFDELLQEYVNGNLKAMESLIEKYNPLVIKIAKRYANYNLELEDLIQYGKIALIKAIKSYNPENGKFISYAWKCIDGTINNAVKNTARTIKIPVEFLNMMASYKKEKENNTLNLTKYKEEDIKLFEIYLNDMLSLDEFHNDGIYPDIAVDDVSQTAIMNLLQEQVKILLESVLSKRNSEIVLLAYRGVTYTDIAKYFNITKSRVGQIINESLIKLTFSNQTKDFAYFMDNPDEALEYLKRKRTEYHQNKK